MFGIKFLLDSPLQSDFITTFFPILRYILVGIVLVASIVIIVAVLLQSDATSGGTNVISGVRESYYAQNRGESRDGKLKKITIIMAIVIAVSVILYFVSLLINGLVA